MSTSVLEYISHTSDAMPVLQAQYDASDSAAYRIYSRLMRIRVIDFKGSRRIENIRQYILNDQFYRSDTTTIQTVWVWKMIRQQAKAATEKSSRLFMQLGWGQ
jgi:hypothetical protein